jgi:hypothetical protein
VRHRLSARRRRLTTVHHPVNASLAARAGTGWELWTLVAIAVVAATAFAIRHSSDLDAEWLACGLVSLLASPLGWAYYLPLVAGPLTAIAMRRPFILLTGLGFLWPVPFAMALVPTSPWANVTIMSLTSWSLIALWCAALSTLTRDGRSWPLRISTPQLLLQDVTPAHR